MRYRRLKVAGACYFFTVVTWNRQPVFSHPSAVDLLRQAFLHVRSRRPFRLDGVVILPDHLHCIWTLPDGDDDFSTRWRLIKTWFSKHYSTISEKCWQNRYWEHMIRDEADWHRHMDYIHYNPVKHGLVQKVGDWPYSSFARCVKKGWYTPDWGVNVPDELHSLDFE